MAGIKIKEIVRQIVCNHNFEWCTKRERFHIISGETQYYVCRKCGKVKETRFIKYD